jgi:hypothetical protein
VTNGRKKSRSGPCFKKARKGHEVYSVYCPHSGITRGKNKEEKLFKKIKGPVVKDFEREKPERPYGVGHRIDAEGEGK